MTPNDAARHGLAIEGFCGCVGCAAQFPLISVNLQPLRSAQSLVNFRTLLNRLEEFVTMSMRTFSRGSCWIGLALLVAAPAAFAQTACTLTCSANITVSTPPGGSVAVVTYPAPIASAGCSAAPVQTAGLPTGTGFPIGTTTNCFSAPGPVANGTCCFQVTVTGTPLQAVQVPTGTPAAWWTLAFLMLAAGGFAATRWSR